MSNNFKFESKKDWHSTVGPTTDSHLQIGCLQRIADSLEKMEQPFANLLAERKRYEEYYRRERDDNRRMGRRIAALQGVITKLKKKKS